MNTRWHDLIIGRLEDGGIHLEQQSGIDDPNVIHLHPEQIMFVARQLCGMKPEPAEMVADLKRRIAIITSRLDDLVSADWLRGQIIERCGDGIEIITKLDGLLDLAIEFDGSRLLPSIQDSSPTEQGERNPNFGSLVTQPQHGSTTTAQQMALSV